jgi:hypothetical protein
MAGRGRPKGATGVKLTDAHRAKIANSNILNALIEHAEGERPMLPSQVTAGLGLLRKVMPDMTENMMKGPGENGEFTMRFKFE